jgi:hypothetical protein
MKKLSTKLWYINHGQKLFIQHDNKMIKPVKVMTTLPSLYQPLLVVCDWL